MTVTDIDPSRRLLTDELGARWVEPEAAATVPADVVVPGALGGLLSRDVATRLDCTVIAGPANNQLQDDSVAEVLAARRILWAPDFVVNAAGVKPIAPSTSDRGTPAVRSRLPPMKRIDARRNGCPPQQTAAGNLLSSTGACVPAARSEA